MKKRLITLFAVLTMLFAMTMTVQAQTGPCVYDTAELLSDSEFQEIETRCENVSNQYGIGVYIITIYNLSDYGFASDEAYDCAKSFYTGEGFGMGETGDGVLLLLSMNDRKYGLIAHGDNGNAAVTDYGNERMVEVFKDDFKDDDWADGFNDYISQAEKYFSMYANGNAYDVGNDPDRHMGFIHYLIVFGGAAIIAFLYLAKLKSDMKTAVLATNAAGYEAENGVVISVKEDTFTHTTTERVEVESSSGGTSVDSDGFSGSSGDF